MRGMRELSFCAHYERVPDSLRREWLMREEENGAVEKDEHYVQKLLSGLGDEEFNGWLAETELLSVVGESNLSLLKGFSVVQFSQEAEEPTVVRVGVQQLRSLAAPGCFFRLAAGTEHWTESRHLMLSFYVISLPAEVVVPELPPEAGQGVDWCTVDYRGRRVCVVGNNGSAESLAACLRAVLPTAAAGECRVDYFTTSSCAELTLEGESLQCLAGSGMGVALRIHQCMKVAAQDELAGVFAHLVADRGARAFINAGAESLGVVVARPRKLRRRVGRRRRECVQV